MRFVRTAGALAAAAAVTFGSMAGPARADRVITASSFGVHSFSTDPQVPAGSLRMNCWPTWRAVEPRQNEFHWDVMDRVVAQVEQWGFEDITFVFCATPQWAAGTVAQPSAEIFGPGSTAAPANPADWRDFATRVVQRYAGRISSYQVWNEITSPQFYQGTTAQMVAMTRDLHQIVRQQGRGAKVVSASVQTHRLDWFQAKAVPYFSGLKAAGWPVDVLSGHFYPPGTGGPNERVAQIAEFNRALNQLQAPQTIKRWDTEGNYSVGVAGDPPEGRVSGDTAATYVARHYLDAWRSGLRRAYWYLWSDRYESFAGVQLRIGDAGTRAYRKLAAWTVGATFKGCQRTGTLVVCKFDNGTPFDIAYANRGSAVLPLSQPRQVCPVNGGACRTAATQITIGTMPMRIR